MADNIGGAVPASEGGGTNRWIQLAMGVVCMAMIANLQYGWTLFVDPINAKMHWGRPAIQVSWVIIPVPLRGAGSQLRAWAQSGGAIRSKT